MTKNKFDTHFRYYKKSKHPALIVGERYTNSKGDEWQYRKVTHSVKDGRHTNECVYPNPNSRDKRPMYIVKRSRYDNKRYFGKRYPWKYKKRK